MGVPLIVNLTLLLGFQLAGEVLTRALGLPLPGPVIGMALLLVALTALPRLSARIADTAQGLLSHLSLLFVPAGVGVIGHLDLLGQSGGPLLLVLVISTALAIAAGALVFSWLARPEEAGHG